VVDPTGKGGRRATRRTDGKVHPWGAPGRAAQTAGRGALGGIGRNPSPPGTQSVLMGRESLVSPAAPSVGGTNCAPPDTTE